jgi:hypothetical protein
MAEEIRFVLGFKTLAEEIPSIVGQPLENEHPSPEGGDQLQQTSSGMLVWRKADNWTAFTDGHRTWVNGPYGIQERLNSERFDWEADYQQELPSPLLELWDSPNCWRGRPYGPPIAIVLHTAVGSEAGMESWLNNPRSQTSAHFGCNFDGDVDQFVNPKDRAWANGVLERGHRWFEMYSGERNGFIENPNNWTISIETEDRGNPRAPVTDDLYLAVHGAVRWATNLYPSIKYLTGHHVISPLSRPNCPGDRWVKSGRAAQLAKETGLTLFM